MSLQSAISRTVQRGEKKAETENLVPGFGESIKSQTPIFHSNRDISAILLRQISKDIGLTIEEFIRNR
jgi:hypothetical protein